MATYQITTDKGTYQVDTENITKNDPVSVDTPKPDLKLNPQQASSDLLKLANTGLLKTVTGQGFGNRMFNNESMNIPDNTNKPFDANVTSVRKPVNQIEQIINQGAAGTVGDILDGVTSPTGLFMTAQGSLNNPVAKQILGNIQSKTIAPIKNQINNILNGNPTDLISKAEKLTTEVLQPTKSELANALERGKQLPAVEQAAKVIKASPDYQSLNQNLYTSINDIFTKRNEILKNNNYDIKPNYMDNLQKVINDTKAAGQATDSELQQMNDVLSREKAWYMNNGNKLSRLDGQSRKEFLQDQTQSLLTKLQTGDIIDTQPARTQALNALRSGLKDAVEGGDAKIAAYNATYNGLKRAKELVSGQQAMEQKAVQQSALQKTVQMVTNPTQIPSIMARNAAEQRASSLLRSTSKIENLMKKSGRGGTP